MYSAAMTLVIPAGFAAVEMLTRHVSASHQAEVTFGIDISDATGGDTDIANACTSIWADAWAGLTDAGVQIGPSIIHIGGASPPYLRVDGTFTAAGTVTGETVPSNCAALVRKLSGQAGRGGRGRDYVPWVLRDSQVDDVGNIDGTTLVNLQTAAENWLTGMQAGDGGSGPIPVVILHNAEGSTAADPPALVSAVVVDLLIATQRRRLGR